MEDFITVKEVSSRLKVSERTIAKWIRLGRVPCYRPERGKRLLKWSQVEEYLESTRQKADGSDTIREALRGLFGQRQIA